MIGICFPSFPDLSINDVVALQKARIIQWYSYITAKSWDPYVSEVLRAANLSNYWADLIKHYSKLSMDRNKTNDFSKKLLTC